METAIEECARRSGRHSFDDGTHENRSLAASIVIRPTIKLCAPPRAKQINGTPRRGIVGMCKTRHRGNDWDQVSGCGGTLAVLGSQRTFAGQGGSGSAQAVSILIIYGRI